MFVTFIMQYLYKKKVSKNIIVQNSEKITKLLQKKLQTGIITKVRCNLILLFNSAVRKKGEAIP